MKAKYIFIISLVAWSCGAFAGDDSKKVTHDHSSNRDGYALYEDFENTRVDVVLELPGRQTRPGETNVLIVEDPDLSFDLQLLVCCANIVPWWLKTCCPCFFDESSEEK